MAARRNIAQTSVEQCNVVRLPTAASRKVKQPSAGRLHAAAKSFDRLAVQYVSPRRREAAREEIERREILKDVRRTPELAIVLALCRVLADEQVSEVRRLLRMTAHFLPDETSIPAALALIGGDA